MKNRVRELSFSVSLISDVGKNSIKRLESYKISTRSAQNGSFTCFFCSESYVNDVFISTNISSMYKIIYNFHGHCHLRFLPNFFLSFSVFTGSSLTLFSSVFSGPLGPLEGIIWLNIFCTLSILSKPNCDKFCLNCSVNS